MSAFVPWDWGSVTPKLSAVYPHIPSSRHPSHHIATEEFHGPDFVAAINFHLTTSKLKLHRDVTGMGGDGIEPDVRRPAFDQCYAVQQDNGIIYICTSMYQVNTFLAYRDDQNDVVWRRVGLTALSADSEVTPTMLARRHPTALENEMMEEEDANENAPAEEITKPMPAAMSDYGYASAGDVRNLFERGTLPAPSTDTIRPMYEWTEVARGIWTGRDDSTKFMNICKVYVYIQQQKYDDMVSLVGERKRIYEAVKAHSYVAGVGSYDKKQGTWFQFAVRCISAE
jgi:hypothetical protein